MFITQVDLLGKHSKNADRNICVFLLNFAFHFSLLFFGSQSELVQIE